MTDLITPSREEIHGLRELLRQWERVAQDNDTELVSLRAFRARALGLFRRLAEAQRANDPIAMERLVQEAADEVVGE